MMSQVYLRFRNRVYDGMNHRRATAELACQALMMAGLLAWAGPANWLFAFVIPFLIQNYTLMSYIATNHNLSPLTSENDPLANSLSVSNHPLLEFANLNFGYHIEHHLFPTVSGAYAKQVHRALLAKFPGEYKIMPKREAIRRLYSTPRIYKNARRLINPETLETVSTI
jgi:fatty acid desaturase